MAVRCVSSLLPPLPSTLDRRTLHSNHTNLITRSRNHWVGSSHGDQRARLPSRARVSAEREVLVREADAVSDTDDIGVLSIHHVGLLCQNLEKSLDFYQNILGLKINEARPHEKLPYRGAWLWVGKEMIHLMELPNPDPLTGRPEHGGRDRHACISIQDVSKLKEIFDKAVEREERIQLLWKVRSIGRKAPAEKTCSIDNDEHPSFKKLGGHSMNSRDVWIEAEEFCEDEMDKMVHVHFCHST